MATQRQDPQLRRTRLLIVGFMIGLALSGITAFPLPQELRALTGWMGLPSSAHHEQFTGMAAWLLQVREALDATESRFPFLFYGYDWLAFAHLVIALMFIGPLRDPVRNIWVIQWAMLACILTWPLTLICGAIRGIPFFWQLIDCSFGVVGLVPLVVCHRWIRQLETRTAPAV